jgi:hypothetical protein
MKLNPDAHWSAAFYRGLDKIQFEDGRDKCTINCDDAAGFRLDTTFTHKQRKSVSSKSNPEMTTRTDYVNKYSLVLQVTSSHSSYENDTSTLCGSCKSTYFIPQGSFTACSRSCYAGE